MVHEEVLGFIKHPPYRDNEWLVSVKLSSENIPWEEFFPIIGS